MKFNNTYEHTVIAPNNNGIIMAQHFPLEQSSVIKTAPPGGRHHHHHHHQQQQHNVNNNNNVVDSHFSPKQEPIDIGSLSQAGLQNLNKMQANGIEQYYMPVSCGYSSRAYEYMNVGAAAYPSMQPVTPTPLFPGTSNSQAEPQILTQEWKDYVYSTSSRNTSSSSSAGIHYITQQQFQQQQDQQEALVLQQQQESLALAQQEQQRLYRAINGGELMPSPGSSTLALGSAVDLALLEEATAAGAEKHNFFLNATASCSSTSENNNSVIAQQHLPHHQHASVITHPHQHHHHQQNPSTSAADLLNSTTTGLIAAAAAAAAAQQIDSGMTTNCGGSQNGGGRHRREHSIGSLSCSARDFSPMVIMKLENPLGFQYILEAPISTSIRREDDRMTYVNKGQFYTISLDYIPDSCKPLKGNIVRSVVMVVFREDKSYEDEIKTWQLWHKRQHTAKQRILEVDTKNSMGIIGLVEEVSHNAIQFCWNPKETMNTKVNIAVQCLSTDFSTQKGVKGLPLHIQIDTYDESDENTKIPFHRGYCQIKVFCDKGAERKLRDEDKRANRRKSAGGGSVGLIGGGGGRKKSEGEFHEMCDRSEFYHMSDLEKPAALFIPSDDFVDARFLDSTSIASFDALSELEPLPKRPRTSERIMIYVREEDEEIYTPLHLTPPTLLGLSHAISEKYNLDETKITAFYKRCCPTPRNTALGSGFGLCHSQCKPRDGTRCVTVKIDDEMVRHYTNQDTFRVEIKSCADESSYCTVTLVELLTYNNSNIENNDTGHDDNCQTLTPPPFDQQQQRHQQQRHQQQRHQQQSVHLYGGHHINDLEQPLHHQHHIGLHPSQQHMTHLSGQHSHLIENHHHTNNHH